MKEQDLLHIVQALANSAELSDDAVEELTQTFVDSIPHPGGSALLYYPEQWGLPANPSPEEIVKAALSWQPQILAMPVTYVRSHPRRKDLLCYGVELQGRIRTQVISSQKFKIGDVCAVAMSGVALPNGKQVRHGFVDGAFTAGEILGKTDMPPGAVVRIADFPNPGWAPFRRGSGSRLDEDYQA